MKQPLYRQAIHQSWRLAWDHKGLWIFGLFAAMLGQMGIVDLLGKISFASKKYMIAQSLGTGFGFKKFSTALQSLSISTDTWFLLVWLSVMLIGLIIFGVFVSVVSQGAIIKSASKFSSGKKLPDTSKSWHAGVSHFWRLLTLNVAKKLVLAVLALIVAVATFNVLVTGSQLDIFIFLILFILAMIAGLVLSFLVIYAAGYVVVEEYSFWKAVSAAWHLFIDHWLVSIEVALIMLAFNLGLVLIIAAGIFVLMLHTVLIYGITLATGVLGIFSAGLFIEFIVLVGFIMFVASVFTVFSTSAWTYLFMKMHKTGIKSHIVKLFHKV